MGVDRGFSIAGLLGGLLDTENSAQLAVVVKEVLAFMKEDHRWVVAVQVRHNPKREGD